MLEWLKWKIARKEMQEREFWHMYWEETRRWLAEFQDAKDALDHLRQSVDGQKHLPIERLRDNMRSRRDEGRS